jgi:hypothetical protein
MNVNNQQNNTTTKLMENNKSVTAVEWLQIEIDNKDMGEIPIWIYQFIEQAKGMEKEQIIDAYKEGCFDNILDESTDKIRAEQYYNETFKKD